MAMPLGLYGYDGMHIPHPFMPNQPVPLPVRTSSSIGLGMVAVNSLHFGGNASTNLRLGVMGSYQGFDRLKGYHPDWEMATSIRAENGTFYVRHKEGISLWMGEQGSPIAFHLHAWEYFKEFPALTPECFRLAVSAKLVSWYKCDDLKRIRSISVGVLEDNNGVSIALELNFRRLLGRIFEPFFLQRR